MSMAIRPVSAREVRALSLMARSDLGDAQSQRYVQRYVARALGINPDSVGRRSMTGS